MSSFSLLTISIRIIKHFGASVSRVKLLMYTISSPDIGAAEGDAPFPNSLKNRKVREGFKRVKHCTAPGQTERNVDAVT